MSETALPGFRTRCLFILAMTGYAVWLTGGRFDFWRYEYGGGLTFNSMLAHLMRGAFDVDPAIVGDEGFRRNGHVYAYWGIFNALLRWPLMLFPGWERIDVTRLSCFVAVSIGAYVKLKTLWIVTLPPRAGVATHGVLYWVMVFAILFSGPQIQFLNPTVYQEVCLWAGTLAAMFVYLAIRGLSAGRYSGRLLCAMALTAGASLHCRVSIGVGLYAALSMLLMSICLQAHRSRLEHGTQETTRLFSGSLLARISATLFILAIFAGAAGIVNYERWGNPLVFADHRHYLMNIRYPDHWPRVETYGLFNLSRLPLGLVYYFLPIWVLHKQDGKLLFEDLQQQLVDAMEFPAGSFFLSDPLLVCLAGYAAWRFFRRGQGMGFDRLQAGMLATGLAAPCLLILTAIYMSHRYRVEFYPLLELGAFLGYLMLQRTAMQPSALRKLRVSAVALVMLGIFVSHLVMLLYRVADLGPSTEYLRLGIVNYHIQSILAHYPFLDRWL